MIMATTIACVRGKIHFVSVLDCYALSVLLVTKNFVSYARGKLLDLQILS